MGQLDGGFARRLGQVLGHAADALRQHHPGDRERRAPGRRHGGEQQETRYKKVIEKSIHNDLVKCRPLILRAGIK